MPTKHLHLDEDTAIHVVHAGVSTLPHLPPPLGSGVALVFLHGEGGSAALWSRQIAHFARAHSPVAIDLPGHGRSTGLDAPASVADAAATVAAVLTALQAPPAVLVGHGLGGQVALATALRQPDRVRAVVTIGTAASPAIAPALVEQLEKIVQGRLGQQFDTPFFGSSPDMAVMREFWGEMVKTDPRVRLGDVRAYRASDLRGALRSLAKPVLVVHGADDRMCERTKAEELAAAIPRARLVVVAGGGHVVHLEQAEAVNRAIEEFVAA
ncbi:MAG TPA: alpha/beta hydrolase [Candidatus Binatia bacterium]|nr:alpha/beta hydrolase [Candidatus Binatia bacterium]